MNPNFAKKFEGLNTQNINSIKNGYNALFQNEKQQDRAEIEIELLVPFPADLYPDGVQPFLAASGDRLEQLTDSIRQYGVIEPITIRKSNRKAGYYEILAGHNRVSIAKSIGLQKVPYILKNVDDAEATDIFVDTNTLQRELSIKELAYAYHMKLVNSNQQGKRTDLSGGEQQNAAQEIMESTGQSKSKIIRLARLTKLIPEFLEVVDQHELPVMVGYNLSFIDQEQQKLIYDCWQVERLKITVAQSVEIRKKSENDELTIEYLDQMLNKTIPDKKSSEKPVIIRFPTGYYKKYFSGMKPKQAQEKLMEILDQYFSTKKIEPAATATTGSKETGS